MIGVDKYTKLLIHFNSSTPADEIGNVLTNTGVTMDTGRQKFGVGSGYFNGSSFISIPGVDKLQFGANDFTIDWWEYRTVTPPSSTGVFFAGNTAGGTGLWVGAQGNYLYLSSTAGSWNIVSGKTMGGVTLNTWQHLALVRSGSTFYIFRNGVLQGTVTSALALVTATVMNIGKYSSATVCDNVYLDEFRISSIARWTANFTPPDSPYNRFALTTTPQIIVPKDIDTTIESGISSIAITDSTSKASQIATVQNMDYVADLSSTRKLYRYKIKSNAVSYKK
jgi:hypothetical protein